MRRVSSWQAILLAIVALVAFVVLAVLLFWLAVAVCVLGLVLWLHLVTLPRLAARLHLRPVVLDGLLLLVLLGGGLAVGGWGGAVTSGVVWVLGVGLPRLAGRRLLQRIQVTRWSVEYDDRYPPRLE